ncbi:immunoglobulin lambda-1 light chain-like isoform X2 [Embiotoca jacksoni]|uniref:immunoglobulin lambda-1 light chain-like isoform X2 n=1 Tax=Embiotoca jacksoni TaxID=100190 RepID=UPI003703A97D
MELKYDTLDSFTSSDTFSRRQVFVSVCFTVGGYDYDHLIFGSGTKLYVTDKPVVKPEVIMYPAACRAHLEGRTFLLCLASAMFPPEVQFSWKRQNKSDSLEEPLSSEGEQLELREPGRTASIRVVDQDDLHTFKYHCYVKHEWDTVKNQTEEEVPAPATTDPPETEPTDPPSLQQADLSFQSLYRVKLLCVLYTVLIVKSLVYCCGLSLMTSLRNKRPSTN